jgi:hypothetical protein
MAESTLRQVLACEFLELVTSFFDSLAARCRIGQ